MKWRIENEVIFLFYAAVIVLHRACTELSRSVAMEIMNKKIGQESYKYECVIL